MDDQCRSTWPATGDPPERVVDPHVHYWHVGVPGLDWPMLAPDFLYPLHRFDNNGSYEMAEHRAESTVIPVSKVIHVTAAQAKDPVAETAWLQHLADRDEDGWPNGIVVAIDLSAPEVASVIDRHREHANFRGVRDVTLSDHLGAAALDRGLRVLAAHNLTCEAMTRLPSFDALADTAARHPDVTFTLGHGGTPMERSEEFLATWRAGLHKLAQHPNVVCKVSGFGIGDHEWTLDSLAPMVEGCIDAFGTDRCIFNGNWPVDKLYSSYDELWGAYDTLTATYTKDERDAMFATNAERIYHI